VVHQLSSNHNKQKKEESRKKAVCLFENKKQGKALILD
jgi:hypothetical protein